jgi:HPt (histidine-containing phosphotransfer) domain-containing protein
MGYNGVIVALTANALKGNVEMFLENGFNGFVAKPIDMRKLDEVLNEYVRDKYPEEAKKYIGSAEEAPVYISAINPKLLDVFRRDAIKAAATIREAVLSNDLKLFTITAHSIKTALGNIGEKEKSKLAADLENAGLNGNTTFIFANAEHFAKELEALAASIKPAEKPQAVQVSEKELTVLFTELKPLLEKADFGAAVYVEKLQGIIGMEELAQRIDDYDFKGALELLATV